MLLPPLSASLLQSSHISILSDSIKHLISKIRTSLLHFSKKKNCNIKPTGIFIPHETEIDWSQGDDAIASNIIGKDAPKGPNTLHNWIKKHIRKKRTQKK